MGGIRETRTGTETGVSRMITEQELEDWIDQRETQMAINSYVGYVCLLYTSDAADD
jgi:hypothetical protein